MQSRSSLPGVGVILPRAGLGVGVGVGVFLFRAGVGVGVVLFCPDCFCPPCPPRFFAAFVAVAWGVACCFWFCFCRGVAGSWLPPLAVCCRETDIRCADADGSSAQAIPSWLGSRLLGSEG